MKLVLLAAAAAGLIGCSRLPDDQILRLTRQCADAGMIAYVDGLDGTVTCRPVAEKPWGRHP